MDSPRVTTTFDNFESAIITLQENTIFTKRLGTGPPVLLVHGFPRTCLMWRDIAPRLAKDFTVVCVDYRGYGQSGVVASDETHHAYTKRAIGDELVALMAELGFDSFSVVGHDRGGRVAYRMALDHPQQIRHVAALDVIPMYEAWSRADARFMKTFWPWSLLSQKAPMPEQYLLGAPQAVFENPFGGGSSGLLRL